MRVVHAVAIVVASLTCAAPALGHALATTTVSVVETRPGLIEVTLEAEADALIAKLETLGGGPVSGVPTTMAERRARLELLFPTLRAHIDARVSGTPLDFALRDVVVDDTAQTAIHLTAKTRVGPHAFTWRSTFVFGAYQLASKNGDGVEVIQWLQGPQTSDPIALEPWDAEAEASALRLFGSRLFNNRISHGVAMGALVLVVLGRRRRGTRLTGGWSLKSDTLGRGNDGGASHRSGHGPLPVRGR